MFGSAAPDPQATSAAPESQAASAAPDPQATSAADSALAYYAQVRRAFSQASARARETRHHLDAGGTVMRLRFAGSGVARAILPALAPLRLSGPATPQVEIELWDQASTGIGIPEPPWRLRDVIARGDVRSLAGGRIRAQVDTGNHTLTMWDVAARRGIMWVADARRLPDWARAAPLRSILHWALASRNRHLVHGAAVGNEAAGALLIGPSGSGKTTTALACLQAGLGYVADDYALVELAPAPRALALYGAAKVSTESLRLLPGLAPPPRATNGAKLALDVARERPDGLRHSAAISTVILPRVTAGRLASRAATAAEALRALAPSTILQHADESATGMALMSALVRQVPAYVLELGSDIAAVPPAVQGLLEAST